YPPLFRSAPFTALRSAHTVRPNGIGDFVRPNEHGADGRLAARRVRRDLRGAPRRVKRPGPGGRPSCAEVALGPGGFVCLEEAAGGVPPPRGVLPGNLPGVGGRPPSCGGARPPPAARVT